MMGGKATTFLPLMWVFVGIVLVFVGLRLYTRLHIVDQLGMDDHVYTLSGVFLFLYVLFLQISAEYGFGRDITTLSADDAADAVKWEMVGQTFAVLGMAIAKWSLGLFLLRIVVQRWHRVAIWSTMISLMLVSVLTAVVFWIQCLPPASIYDRRVEGRCIVKITPVSILLGGKRIPDLEATVGLIVWSAAEMALTMVCIGIPVLRPLFSRWFPILAGSSRDRHRYNRYNNNNNNNNNDNCYNSEEGRGGGPVFTMHTIGGKTMKGRGGRSGGAGGGGGGGGGGNDRGFPHAPAGSGLRGPTTRTRISAQDDGGHGSEEEILGSVHRHSGAAAAADQGDGILVREDVRVEYDSDHGAGTA
ncbi:hypothetical protein VMCG_08147 [Cytospora schulzeri]|uniref:Rhodopsin domain-containing protein n=1 Tax=Cytospora schulzeri TaxID=448051 RepID=A0A423VUB9_9PEZI|nr:hypothetical protein VMCG_08147 [Valsa malicola]